VVEAGLTHTRVSHLRDTRARQAELAELAGGESGEAFSYAASLLEPLPGSQPRGGQSAA
jgi:DNA repair protein RecN (Recombination protein N)